MYKKTSPYVISLLLASVSTVHVEKTGKGHTHDIAESDVDPWVYDNVSDAVEYRALGRSDEAPKVDKYWLNAPGSFVPGEIKGLGLTSANTLAQ
jgi:hypothetical protein